MKKTAVRAALTAAVMLTVILILAGAADPFASKYPVRSWKGPSCLELHDMAETEDGFIQAGSEDSYAEIRGIDMPVRSVTIRCPSIRRTVPEVPGTVQIYYDLGDDYFEVYSVQVKLKEGQVRAVIRESRPVKNLRFDFFSEAGGKILIEEVLVNEPERGNVPYLIVFALFMTGAALWAAFSAPAAGWAVFLAGDAALLLSGGLPVRETGAILPVLLFAVFSSLMLSLLAVLLFMKDGRKKERLFAVLLVTAAAAFYFTWSLMTPFGEGPDEAMHYDVVDFIHTYGYLPRGDDPRIRNDVWGFSYAFSPILPFIIGAGIDAVLKQFTGDFFALIMGARMVSILSGALTAFLLLRIGRRLFPGRRAGYVLPLAAAFFPELAFLFTYINSDAFAIMTCALIVLFWLRGADSGWTVRDQAGLAAGIGLCALTYYNCYGYILMSVPVFFFTAAVMGKDRKFILRSAMFITVTVFLICGWWFIRNGILYHGDILGRRTLNETEELYALPQYRPSQIHTPKSDGYSLPGMIFSMGWLKSTYESFIAMFSHYRLPGRVIVFRLYKRFFALAAAGLLPCVLQWVSEWRRSGKCREDCGGGRRPETSFRMKTVLHVNLIFAAVIPVCLALYYSYASDYQPQGRYIMPCIIPLMYFCTAGFEKLDSLAERAAKRLFPGSEIRARSFFFGGLQIIFQLSCCLGIFFDTVWFYYR